MTKTYIKTSDNGLVEYVMEVAEPFDSTGLDEGLHEIDRELANEITQNPASWHYSTHNRRFKELPPCPYGIYSVWGADESWLPDLDSARNAKLEHVSVELNQRLYLPCNGFDADKMSRDRISGMIARLQRGDGLPAGWMGWRDADNQQHWAKDDAATVLANLYTLSRAIEDREQALLVASWTHKANIAALEDIDAILAYDVTKNWPT